MAKGKNTVAVVTELARPIVEEMGLRLWDVRFEKEGATWYLRIFLEKEEGISIDDCETFSRRMDKILDDADPIDQSYVFEVGSPGIERELVKDWHFQQYLGALVTVRFIRPVDGRKDLVAELAGYQEGAMTLRLEDGREMRVPISDTAFVKLYDDYDMGGLD